MNDDAQIDALIEDLLAGRLSVGDSSTCSPAARRVGRLARMLAAVACATADEPEPAGSAPGEVLGAWRLLRPLGRGGMGEVWLAERCDGQVEQQVAIKRVHARGATLVRRMQRERRALARLAHPHIARFLDAGVDAQGAPYLVMEYVDGEPIDQWCERTQATLATRVDLLVGIGEALAHAHRQLVVHRDLKPANALVDRSGSPRLLDFGIARLLEDTGDGATDTGLAPMTPAYAAPEQLLGDEISTATDVHALALLGYRLLTGGLPALREQAIGARQALRIAQEGAEPASVALARRGGLPGIAPAQLRGDLDAILALAMRPEPGARYASVEALTEDLRRYRAGLPVAARGRQRGYRWRRFAWRYRGRLAAGAIAVAGLLGGSALAWQQAERALAANRASQAVQRFLEDVFVSADPWRSDPPGSVPTALDLARRGLDRIDAELADQPRMQADLYLRLGRVFTVAGSRRDAVRAFARAVELHERLPEIDLVRRIDTRLRHAGVLFYSGDYDAAQARLEQLARDYSPAELDASGQGFHLHTLRMDLARERGHYAESLRHNAAALAVVDSVDDPPRMRASLAYYRVLTRVRSGEIGAAADDALEALSRLDALSGVTPQWRAHVLDRCLQVLLALGPEMADLERAERNRAQRALLFGGNSGYHAQSLLTLARAEYMAGRIDAAAAHAAQAARHFAGGEGEDRSARDWAEARYLEGLAALEREAHVQARTAAADAHAVFAGYGGEDAPPALAAAALVAAADPAAEAKPRLAQILSRQHARLDLAAPLSALWLARQAHARGDDEGAAQHADVGLMVLRAQGRPEHRLAAAFRAIAPAAVVDSASIGAAGARTAELRARIDVELFRVDQSLR